MQSQPGEDSPARVSFANVCLANLFNRSIENVAPLDIMSRLTSPIRRRRVSHPSAFSFARPCVTSEGLLEGATLAALCAAHKACSRNGCSGSSDADRLPSLSKPQHRQSCEIPPCTLVPEWQAPSISTLVIRFRVCGSFSVPQRNDCRAKMATNVKCPNFNR